MKPKTFPVILEEDTEVTRVGEGLKKVPVHWLSYEGRRLFAIRPSRGEAAALDELELSSLIKEKGRETLHAVAKVVSSLAVPEKEYQDHELPFSWWRKLLYRIGKDGSREGKWAAVFFLFMILGSTVGIVFGSGADSALLTYGFLVALISSMAGGEKFMDATSSIYNEFNKHKFPDVTLSLRQPPEEREDAGPFKGPFRMQRVLYAEQDVEGVIRMTPKVRILDSEDSTVKIFELREPENAHEEDFELQIIAMVREAELWLQELKED